MNMEKKSGYQYIDELLDVVDEHDNAIAVKPRSEVYANKLNFRAINVFIENDKGQLWIPRRVADKRVFPLCLDMSCAGHVESGEDYEQTVLREVQEELNIDLHTTPYTFLGYLSPYKDGVSAFVKVYKIKMNETPRYNPTDFCEAFWLTPKELMQRLENGDKSKSDLPTLVRIFYGDQL